MILQSPTILRGITSTISTRAFSLTHSYPHPRHPGLQAHHPGVLAQLPADFPSQWQPSSQPPSSPPPSVEQPPQRPPQEETLSPPYKKEDGYPFGLGLDTGGNRSVASISGGSLPAPSKALLGTFSDVWGTSIAGSTPRSTFVKI
eukprot:5540640-Pyramimonas_sp.AAC.1